MILKTVEFNLITVLPLLDMVLTQLEKNIGLLETHGEPNGVMLDISKLPLLEMEMVSVEFKNKQFMPLLNDLYHI
jgi:hypothetical protein